MSDSETDSTTNHYSCEFNSMKDPSTEQTTQSTVPSTLLHFLTPSQSGGSVEEVVRQLRSLTVEDERKPKLILESFDLEGVVKYMQKKKVKNVICMCGAGISVNAGIPDFRTPGTGLYSRLAEMGLESPEDVFSIDFFKRDPKPFYGLAKEIMPGKFKPTKTHLFMKLLQDKKMLLRVYSQNIDSLESQAGVDRAKIVAAHGNFDSARCSLCGKQVEISELTNYLKNGKVMNCRFCSGVIKPDIVFYGEALPRRFFECAKTDFTKCDLLIVMGSSLVVHPFCSFVDNVTDTTPRLLINREWARGGFGFAGSGFQRGAQNYRDAYCLGDCDEGVTEFAKLLGFKEDFDKLGSKQ